MTRPGPVTPASGDELVRIASAAYGRKELSNLRHLVDDAVDLGLADEHDPMVAAIAAVRPLIEAEVRARIADELDGLAPLFSAVEARLAYKDAARIARGETP